VACQLDPEILQAVTSVPTRAAPTPAERDDHQTLRNNGESGLAAIEATLPERHEVERVDHFGASSYLNIRGCLRPLRIEHSEQRWTPFETIT
jgi:hypothetical protein